MKSKITVALVLILGLAFCAAAEEGNYNFDARTRVYAYAMGGNFHLTAAGSGLWDVLAYTDDAIAPTLGVGFSLFNVRSRFFLNLEADFTTTTLISGNHYEFRTSTLAFMIHGEYRLGRKGPVSIYGGVGVGVIHKNGGNFPAGYEWLYVPESTDTTLVSELGIKVSITRRLMFRAAMRAYSLVDEYYGDYGLYWDDYLDLWMDDYNSELYATSFMAGLELHF